MTIIAIGVYLAKNECAAHDLNAAGVMQLRQPVAGAKLDAMIAARPPCTIGMEACSGTRHWARLFMQHGHTAHQMAVAVEQRQKPPRSKRPANPS